MALVSLMFLQFGGTVWRGLKPSKFSWMPIFLSPSISASGLLLWRGPTSARRQMPRKLPRKVDACAEPTAIVWVPRLTEKASSRRSLGPASTSDVQGAVPREQMNSFRFYSITSMDIRQNDQEGKNITYRLC